MALKANLLQYSCLRPDIMLQKWEAYDKPKWRSPAGVPSLFAHTAFPKVDNGECKRVISVYSTL